MTLPIPPTPPQITEGSTITVTMSQGGVAIPFALTLHATDVNGDAITWAVTTQPVNGAATAVGSDTSAVAFFIPPAAFSGIDSFVVTVSDSVLTSAIVVTVRVVPVIIGISPAFKRMMAKTFTIRRKKVEGEKETGATEVVAIISATNIYPIDAETKPRMVLNGPTEFEHFFSEGVPFGLIVEGDSFTDSGFDYEIRGVAKWGGVKSHFIQFFIERLK